MAYGHLEYIIYAKFMNCYSSVLHTYIIIANSQLSYSLTLWTRKADMIALLYLFGARWKNITLKCTKVRSVHVAIHGTAFYWYFFSFFFFFYSGEWSMRRGRWCRWLLPHTEYNIPIYSVDPLPLDHKNYVVHYNSTIVDGSSPYPWLVIYPIIPCN